jgi:hypothetical protein
MSRRNGLLLTVIFWTLGFLTSSYLFGIYGWIVSLQLVSILAIGSFGEHIVSSQGYYHYTELNGLFIGKVASWIPFMWAFVIQGLFIVGLWFGLDGFSCSIFSGVSGSLIDFALIEPFCSKRKSLWVWKQVEKGYFSFVPERFNRFTAPTGNYATWFVFPVLMSLMIVIPSMLF